MNTKKITRLALLTAIALTIFMIEAQLPPLTPVAGIKLGLSNIITVFAAFTIGSWEAAAILAVRVFLGSVFSGQMSAILYSAAGGILSIFTTIMLRKILTKKQIWVAGSVGAMAHNVGQMLVALAITRTPQLIYYLPILLLSGIITGLFTGLAAQVLVNHMNKLSP